MGLYLSKLPSKKLEIINSVGKFIGQQNTSAIEIDINMFSDELINKHKDNNEVLICVIDNGTFDAAAVVLNMNDVIRYGDIDGEYPDYRPHYWYWLNEAYMFKFMECYEINQYNSIC